MESDPASLKRIIAFLKLLQRAKAAKIKPTSVTTPTEQGDNIHAVVTIKSLEVSFELNMNRPAPKPYHGCNFQGPPSLVYSNKLAVPQPQGLDSTVCAENPIIVKNLSESNITFSEDQQIIGKCMMSETGEVGIEKSGIIRISIGILAGAQ